MRFSLHDLLDVATKYNITRKAGAFYSYKDQKLGQGREKVKVYLTENPDVYKNIEKDVKTLAFGKPEEIEKMIAKKALEKSQDFENLEDEELMEMEEELETT